MMLDLESVRLFVLTVEYGNLTRAAEAAGTVQPVVSQRIRSLEAMVGQKLLDRSPRLVRLTEAGAVFLAHARSLLAAHQRALAFDVAVPSPLAIGISDHAMGTHFDLMLQRVQAALPAPMVLSVKLGQSGEIRAAFVRGEIDLAVVRGETPAATGEDMGLDPLHWYTAPGWQRPDGPLPIILLPPPCGVRAVAVKALDRAGISWREAFVGGSCMALIAAVQAGLGVAPLGQAVAASMIRGAIVDDLPSLPASHVMMLARASDPHVAAAARALAASLRTSLTRS